MKLSNIKKVTEVEQLNNSIELLIEWSGKPKYNIIFDSDLDGDGKLTLSWNVMNKKNLYLIHFDNENNVFGGYVNEVIDKKDGYINDPKSFVFSLIRNGKITNKKYDIDFERAGLSFAMQYNFDVLYWFGYGNGKFDLIIFKIGYISENSCVTNSYKYNGEKQPLRDNTIGYIIQRILVLEMI
ncbi:TLDc domain-containing protein [Entamoeba marina]